MAEIESKAKSLLDINPEGNLLREIKDILDELHIMLDIKSIQQRILKDFRKHVEFLIVPQFADFGGLRKPKGAKKIHEGDPDTEYERWGRNKMTKEDFTAERDARWTMELGLNLSASLDDRVADLKALKDGGERTETAVSLRPLHNNV